MNTELQKSKPIVTEDLWEDLKQFTDARIALGRCGAAIPLAEVLKFKMAHAQARDAVHTDFDAEPIKDYFNDSSIDFLELQSNAEDRSDYLVRPDRGRVLSPVSADMLREWKRKDRASIDFVLVISDGLSATAMHENVIPFLKVFLPMFQLSGLNMGPAVLVKQGRVAVGDHIAELLGAKSVGILIGERPGLSSPDSMGIYLSYNARVGTTDEARNCISNVRKAGLSYCAAAQKLSYLLEQSHLRSLSGVNLKDGMSDDYKPFSGFFEQAAEVAFLRP
jgi:ethanolamine ammonia-lyase small subunit